MSDFSAKIIAQLDTSKIPSQLAKIQSMISKQKFVITVDTSATKNINQVTNAFNDLMKLQNRINSTRIKLAGLDSNKDSAQIKELSGQLNRLMADYNNLHSTFSKSFSTNQLDALNRGFETASNKISVLNAKASDTKGVAKLERSFTRLIEIANQMGKIQVKINGLDATKNSAEITQLVSQFRDLESQYNRLKTSLNGKISGVQSSQLSNELKNTQNQLAQLDAKVQDTKRRLSESINIKISNGSFESSIAKVTAEYEKLASTGHSRLSEIKADIESLRQLQAQMSNATNSTDLVSAYDKFNSTLKKVKNTLSTVSAESKTFASNLQMSKLDNSMAAWLEKNSKAAKDYGASIEKLRSELAALMNSGSPVPASSVANIQNQFSAIQQSAVAAGKTGSTWGARLKGSLSSISSYISTTTMIYAGIRGLKEMYQNVSNIDSAMVELKKVTDETDETYDKFLSGTNKKAQEIGTTITGLVSSTGDFARLGYTFEESQKLAETANIYAVVGDEISGVDEATESIISTMKAFGIQANDSISVVDKFNEVGNRFAISSGGIGEAMKRSASSMAAANNTIDETVALIAAANEIVQNPEKVGTAFKTISMRIRGVKTELEEAGLDTDGMADTTAKLQAEVKALSGVDIMKDKNTFKSTYQIMDELSQKWDKLTDKQQAALTELLAGKHQGNVMASLMTNFDKAREALSVSMNSEGSAMKEHEKWLDSVEAKQLQLKASWEGLSKDFLSSDLVKGIVDGARSVLNAIDSIVNAIGTLGTVATGAGLFGLKKFIGTKGLTGLVKVATSVPAPLLAVAASVAAVGVAIYAVNKYNYNKKYKWGDGLVKQSEKIKKYSDELTKLNKLSAEVKDLKLVINSPRSSVEDVENAKNRIKEISDLLNKDYNLNITADPSAVEDTLNLLTQQTRGEMVDSAKDYISKVEKNSENYKKSKTTYADDKARLSKLEKLNASYQELQSQYSLIDWFDDDVDGNLAKAQKIYDKFAKLHKTAVDLGVNDTEKGAVHLEDMEGIPLDELSENDYYTVFFAEMNKVKAAYDDAKKQLPDITNSIQEFEESSQKASKYLAQALASDVQVNNTYGVDTDVMLIEKLASALQKAGKSTDGVAKDFAIAKQGFTDFSSAINAGKLNDVIQEYIRFSKKFKESNESIVRNTALLKQGFTDATQVTAESVNAIYSDMKDLGKNNGINDYVKNAIQNTALLASGFNTVEDATNAGVDGVNSVLNKIKEIGDIDDYWKDMSNDEIVDKITDIAHAMDLLPDNYVVSIDDNGKLNGFVKDVQACADYLKELGKTKIDFDFNTANLDSVEEQIKEARKILNSFKDEDGTIDINADGAVEAQTVLANLLAKKQQLSEQPAVMKIDTSQISGELGAALSTIQNFQSDMNDFQIKAEIGADTSGIQSVIQNTVSTLNNLSPEVKASLGLNTSEYEAAVNTISSAEIDVNAGVNLDSTALATIQSAISNISPEILVKAGVDSSLVTGYVPEDKTATVTYSCVHTDVDNYNPPNLTRTVTYKKAGDVGVDGTAHVDGTAFKTGSWGTKNSGTALGGELGEELVVRDGKFFTIGSDSAEFFSYKKGDIIFNADQTKQIFSKGKITHGNRRGKAFYTGTAFAKGSDKPEKFDWIETFSNRVESNIKRFTDGFKNTYTTLTNRFINLGNAVTETQNQIRFKQQAYDRYMEQAKSVGLDESWAAKIRDGEFDISSVSDETLKEKINDYKEWYEKAIDCKEAIDDLHASVSDLYKDNFDNIEKAYDNILTSIEHKAKNINNYIDRAEEQGLVGSTRYYTALQSIENENLQQLEYKRNDLINALNDAINNGEIEVHSESWYELRNSIDEVTEAIDESKTALIKYDNEMRQISWDRFDYLNDTISQFKDESDFLIDLLDGDDLYNDNGQLSNKGLSILGLHGLNYNTLMSQSSSYAKEIAKINRDIANNPGDDNLIQRKQELLKLQRDSVLAAKDEKEAMIDLIKNGVEKETDALKDLIDKYNDSLDSAKDLYDYQNRIKEHTKDIASIEKQLSAYQNDTSEETKATVQKLKNDLKEAQQDLKDTEYDRYVSDQKELLDNLYNEYENLMNERLDKIDTSFEDLIDKVNSNSSVINNTLSKESSAVGVTLSNKMHSVWTSQNTALSKYFSNGGIILNNVSGYFENTNTALTGINTVLNEIKDDVNNVVKYASYQARVNIDPEGSKNQMIQNSLDWFATDDNTVRSSLASDNEAYGKAFGYTKKDGSWYDNSGNLVYSVSDDDKIRNIVSKMKANSSAWGNASESERIRLSNANVSYANKIRNLTNESVYRDNNGVWWIGDKELYSYKSGGLADFTGTAWLDGTPNKPELVLNSQDTKNFIALKDVLNGMTKQGISIENMAYGSLGKVPQLSGLTDISSMLLSLRQSESANTSKSIGDISITIPIEHVDDYNDFISQLQKDKQFEKFVRSVSIDLLNGGSTLAKNRYKW